jgi:uncharacterized protein (TIRG00374 family)
MAIEAPEQDLVRRFRRWVVWAILIGAVLYIGGSVWAGFDDVAEQLQNFSWWIYAVVILLTLVNYSLRFVKWHYLLHVLKVKIPLRVNAAIFVAGLSMVISPGKAGELLKPYLVSKRTRAPMATTVPALIAERLTDGIAMVILAAISVGTFAADEAWILWVLAGCVAVGLAILAHQGLSLAILGVLAKLPLVGRIGHKLEELYRAMRACLAPVPFVATTLLSVVAWGAECVGFLLCFKGLGAQASLDAATFIYAFATVAGGAMPGGLGVAEGALVVGTTTIMGIAEPIAVAAALLVRVATLWLGVLMGALALLRFEDLFSSDLTGSPDPESAKTDHPGMQ